MNPLVMHFASGASFFSGLSLIAVSVVFSLLDDRLAFKVLARCLMLAGFAGVLLSSTPTPSWLLTLLVVLCVALMAVLHAAPGSDSARLGWPSVALRCALLAACALCAGLELRMWFAREAPRGSFSKMFLIGDSISAGVGFKGERTWWEIVRDERSIGVVSMSVGGATLGSSMIKPSRIDDGPAFVLVELGGNDLFKGTSARDFERDLDSLLGSLAGPGRVVVMLELPLPPFRSSVGEAQRRLAKKHGVILVPKRVFASVLSGSDSTVDGLHLSNAGHRKMADAMWAVISPAFGGR